MADSTGTGARLIFLAKYKQSLIDVKLEAVTRGENREAREIQKALDYLDRPACAKHVELVLSVEGDDASFVIRLQNLLNLGSNFAMSRFE